MKTETRNLKTTITYQLIYLFWTWYINWISSKAGAWFSEAQQYSLGGLGSHYPVLFPGKSETQASSGNLVHPYVVPKLSFDLSCDVKSPLFLSGSQAQLPSFPVSISDPVHKLHLHWLPEGKGLGEVKESRGRDKWWRKETWHWVVSSGCRWSIVELYNWNPSRPTQSIQFKKSKV